MGAAQHRNVTELRGRFEGQRLLQPLELGKQYILHAIVQHEGIREIIDIFRGAREVQVLLKWSELSVRFKLLFQEVLYSFHIVICSLLYLFDSLSVLQ